jgi:hypothetical protein
LHHSWRRDHAESPRWPHKCVDGCPACATSRVTRRPYPRRVACPIVTSCTATAQTCQSKHRSSRESPHAAF